MPQYLKLTLYNEINLLVTFQDYFGHVWEYSDPVLLRKIRLLASLIQAGFCQKGECIMGNRTICGKTN